MKKIVSKHLTNYNDNNQIETISNYSISILNYTKLQIYLDLIKNADNKLLLNNHPILSNNDKILLLNLGIFVDLSFNNQNTNNLIHNIENTKNDIVNYLGNILYSVDNNSDNIIENQNNKIEDLLIIIEKLLMYRF